MALLRTGDTQGKGPGLSPQGWALTDESARLGLEEGPRVHRETCVDVPCSGKLRVAASQEG